MNILEIEQSWCSSTSFALIMFYLKWRLWRSETGLRKKHVPKVRTENNFETKIHHKRPQSNGTQSSFRSRKNKSRGNNLTYKNHSIKIKNLQAQAMAEVNILKQLEHVSQIKKQENKSTYFKRTTFNFLAHFVSLSLICFLKRLKSRV